MENTRPSSWAPPPLLGVRGQERGSLSPESRAGRKAFGYYPEEESFAVSGQMGGVRWNQLAEKKGENSEFQFSKQRLFFFFKKRKRLIIFFFQTDFHACLGVDSWCLKSVVERPKWCSFLGEIVDMWLLFSVPLPPHPHSSSFRVPSPPSTWQPLMGGPICYHLRKGRPTAARQRHRLLQRCGALV